MTLNLLIFFGILLSNVLTFAFSRPLVRFYRKVSQYMGISESIRDRDEAQLVRRMRRSAVLSAAVAGAVLLIPALGGFERPDKPGVFLVFFVAVNVGLIVFSSPLATFLANRVDLLPESPREEVEAMLRATLRWSGGINAVAVALLLYIGRHKFF